MAGSRRSDHGPLAHRIQAGRGHDPKARHLYPDRAAARRVPGSAVRRGGGLHNHPRFVRWYAPGYSEALAFAAQGKVKADIDLQPPSSINQIFERLEHGDVPSRVVLDFAPAKAKERPEK